MSSFNCLVVGVGGQGVVLASRLVAAACMAKGAFVRTAETIGMSQRGGSVMTHVRVGTSAADLPSSLIGAGGANLVIAFEPGEAVRAMPRLAKGGLVVCSTRAVVPAAAATSGYDGTAQVTWLREQLGARGFASVDPATIEGAGLSPKCLNVALLGAALAMGALPFDEDDLRAAMTTLIKPKLLEMNQTALELGIQAVRG